MDEPGHAEAGDFLDEMAAERTAANPAFPRLVAAAARRRELVRQLVALRTSLGLSQTAVAARMSTSQPVVARLEAGDLDSRISTLERYADAVGVELELGLRNRGAGSGDARGSSRGAISGRDVEEARCSSATSSNV